MQDRKLKFTRLEDALKELESIASAKKVIVSGTWDLAQILTHCAESIEYSMIGFPKHKPAIIRKTIGRIVFKKFSSQGYMSHDLNAPIPGAPSVSTGNSLKDSVNRLIKAIGDFKSFKGEYKIHFVYDSLTKEEWEKAHAMHIANHFSFIQIEN